MPRRAKRTTILTDTKLGDLSNSQPTSLGGGYTASEISSFRQRVSRWNSSELRIQRGLPVYAVTVDPATGEVTVRPGQTRKGTPYSNRAWIHTAAGLPPGQALAVKLPEHTPSIAAGRNAIAAWNRRYPDQRLTTRTLATHPDQLIVHRPGIRRTDLEEGIVNVVPYLPLVQTTNAPPPPAPSPRDTARQAADEFRARVQARQEGARR